MKIESFEFNDRESKWKVQPIQFKSLTLLVGASGVGKTRILKSLNSLKNIASGKPLNGVEWKIIFSIQNNHYIWEGKYELNEKSSLEIAIGRDETENTTKKSNIFFEKIVLNDVLIFERNGKEITYRDNISTIPIKAAQSFLAISNDPEIEKAQKAFSKILYSDYSNFSGGLSTTQFINQDIIKKYKNTDELMNSEESLIDKLYWVYKKNKNIFSRIKSDFKIIFPQIEDLKIESIEELKDSSLPLLFKISPFIQIKEEGIEDWLHIINISAGMYRSLVHIMELHLSPDETVILIDEFENSLGINCIDEVINQIKEATNRIQFIITSHHPYIINNINYKSWKIVTRNGSNVFVQEAEDFDFDKSKHQAFIQLINLQEYKTGIKKI